MRFFGDDSGAIVRAVAHHSEASFSFSKMCTVVIISVNLWTGNSVSFWSSRIGCNSIEQKVSLLNESTHLRFIAQAYYGALQSQDQRAKFYHAFTIMEYLEQKVEVGSKRYSEDLANQVGEELGRILEAKGFEKEDTRSLKSGFLGMMKRMTNENRQEKLRVILNEKFGITQIRYYGTQEVPIDKSKTKQFIDTRNKLFHGSTQDINLREVVDHLILVCEKIYWLLLDDKKFLEKIFMES